MSQAHKYLALFPVQTHRKLLLYCLGFEALTAVVKNVAIFWAIVPYSRYLNQRLGGTYTSIFRQVARKNKLSAEIPVTWGLEGKRKGLLLVLIGCSSLPGSPGEPIGSKHLMCAGAGLRKQV
jgi:hypothetical protein